MTPEAEQEFDVTLNLLPEPQLPPSRLLVAGDWHGNTTAAERVFTYAKRNHCEAVIQAGDFGVGWSFRDSEDILGPRSDYASFQNVACWYIDKCARLASKYGIPLWFIDGNHENYDFMELIGLYGATEPVEAAPGVWYAPRGSVVNVNDKRMLFIGGAYSVDKPGRTPWVSWWPQETLTYAEVDRALAHDPVDIVISHDAPDAAFAAAITAVVDGELANAQHLVWKNDVTFPDAKPNRMALQAVLEHHKPELWIHGHYHTYYEADVDGTHVIGLNYETRPNSCVILHDNDTTVF